MLRVNSTKTDVQSVAAACLQARDELSRTSAKGVQLRLGCRSGVDGALSRVLLDGCGHSCCL